MQTYLITYLNKNVFISAFRFNNANMRILIQRWALHVTAPFRLCEWSRWMESWCGRKRRKRRREHEQIYHRLCQRNKKWLCKKKECIVYRHDDVTLIDILVWLYIMRQGKTRENLATFITQIIVHLIVILWKKICRFGYKQIKSYR